VDRTKCLWSFTFRPDGDSDPVVFAAFPVVQHRGGTNGLHFKIPESVAPAFRSVHEAAEAGGMPIRLDTSVYPQMEDVALVDCSDGSLCRTAVAKRSGGVGGGGKPAGVLERRLAHHLVEPHREHRWQRWKDEHDSGDSDGSSFSMSVDPLSNIRIDKTVGWNMVRMTETESDLSDEYGEFAEYGGYDDYDAPIVDEYGRRRRTVHYVHELNLDLDVQGDNCFLMLTARQSKSGAKASDSCEGVHTPFWTQVSLLESGSLAGSASSTRGFLDKWTSARGAGQAIVHPTWYMYE
jgi:hypothetical protein